MPGITAENEVTVKNLLAAFGGESNAHAKYTAFAAKAGEDGFHGVASLFRAAARAEQIHAANHARVIRSLGGNAECEIHEPQVADTLENLKTALGGEQYEIDPMYPGFIAEAKERGNDAAVRVFHFAIEAEKTHARLYAKAIAFVEAGNKDVWVAQAHDFFVCPNCGYTSETPNEYVRCPVCNCAWERFETIR
jgi:rubrerythrin